MQNEAQTTGRTQAEFESSTVPRDRRKPDLASENAVRWTSAFENVMGTDFAQNVMPSIYEELSKQSPKFSDFLTRSITVPTDEARKGPGWLSFLGKSEPRTFDHYSMAEATNHWHRAAICNSLARGVREGMETDGGSAQIANLTAIALDRLAEWPDFPSERASVQL